MKQAIGLGLAVLAFAFAGCSNDPAPSEKQASTTSNLSGGDAASCIGSIQAPPGSADWQAQLRQCTQNTQPGSSASGGDSQACSSGVSCNNGACTCNLGPNQGQSCDGTTDTGANSCSVLCHYCSTSGGGAAPPPPANPGGDAPGGAIPPLPSLPGGWDPGGAGGSSQSCTSGISCVNGACTCSSGPNQGQSCDGSTATGAGSCSVLCSSCN